MKSIICAALAVAATAAPAFAATTTYNSAPAAGWHYGNGNDYSPANTVVLTTDANDELSLRWHMRGDAAPASVGDTYFFALGTNPLSFDWGYDYNVGARRNLFATALITIKNIGTGQSVTYNSDVFQPDSYRNAEGNVQNSAHLGFAFLSGVGYNPNVNGLYSVTLDVDGMSGGPQTLTAFAQIGAGVPEPAAWAMMIGGFGMLGAAARRRTRTTVTYA